MVPPLDKSLILCYDYFVTQIAHEFARKFADARVANSYSKHPMKNKLYTMNLAFLHNAWFGIGRVTPASFDAENQSRRVVLRF